MKILYKIIGGSQLYGLSTPQSDVDYRGVFCNTDPDFILGTKRFDEQIIQNGKEDTVMREVRQFFCLLKKQNTECLEMLFADNSYSIFCSSIFTEIKSRAFSFLDTDRLFLCLRGYIKSELRLTLGERTGALGGKRKTALDKYGYSPKNAANLLRLIYTGIVVFREGRYPVNMRPNPTPSYFQDLLLKIRQEPQIFSKNQIEKYAHDYEKHMVSAYENTKYHFNFDEKLANHYLKEIYKEYLI